MSKSTSGLPKRAETSMTQSATGLHKFKIANYSLIKQMEHGKFISSSIFTIDGYNWVIHCYPRGFDPRQRSVLGVILELRSEVTNLNAGIEFALLNKKGESIYLAQQTKMQNFEGRGSKVGFYDIIGRADTYKGDYGCYVVNDCITIQCTITIIKPSILKRSFTVPPSDFSRQFGNLLKSKEGTDIAIDVNGKVFNAHKSVLAARSPAFKEILFGDMGEGNIERIKVVEMEASIFEAMLHFIYTDSLPELNNHVIDSSQKDSIQMAQDLLEAAVQYRLERLKFLCAELLYENIEKWNVISTLALAEGHGFSELKDACLEFIATSMNLKDIMVADGFENLIQVCPAILKDLREKLK